MPRHARRIAAARRALIPPSRPAWLVVRQDPDGAQTPDADALAVLREEALAAGASPVVVRIVHTVNAPAPGSGPA